MIIIAKRILNAIRTSGGANDTPFVAEVLRLCSAVALHHPATARTSLRQMALWRQWSEEQRKPLWLMSEGIPRLLYRIKLLQQQLNHSEKSHKSDWISTMGKTYFPSTQHQDRLWERSTIRRVKRAIHKGLERSGSKADLSAPTIAEDDIRGSVTSTPPFVLMTYSLISE